MINRKTIFADGMFAKKRKSSPDFIVCELSFKVRDFKIFLDENVNESGFVNVDVKLSKKGDCLYSTINNYRTQINNENIKSDPVSVDNILSNIVKTSEISPSSLSDNDIGIVEDDKKNKDTHQEKVNEFRYKMEKLAKEQAEENVSDSEEIPF